MISEIPLRKSDYNNMKNTGKIKVTTVDGMKYELTQFHFTDTNIIGYDISSIKTSSAQKKAIPIENSP